MGSSNKPTNVFATVEKMSVEELEQELAKEKLSIVVERAVGSPLSLGCVWRVCNLLILPSNQCCMSLALINLEVPCALLKMMCSLTHT